MEEASGQPESELATIRHEINNVLTGIIGHTQLLRLRGNLDDKARQRVETIEQLANRLRELADKIRDGEE